MSNPGRRSKKQKPDGADPKPPYVPTPFEQTAATQFIERRKNSPRTRFKLGKQGQGKFTMIVDHQDPPIGEMVMMNSLATANSAFADAMLTQLAGLASSSDGEVDKQKLEKLLAMAQAIRPKDEVEAMLAVQMAAVHQATMDAARYLKGSMTLPSDSAFSNSLNKLARTFSTQVEALKKHRSTGEQHIKVQHVNHVTVAEGAQAVVGEVHTGGGGSGSRKEHQPHEFDAATPPSLTYAPSTPVFGNVQALRPAMQGAGSEGLECVPLSRSEGRSP